MLKSTLAKGVAVIIVLEFTTGDNVASSGPSVFTLHASLSTYTWNVKLLIHFYIIQSMIPERMFVDRINELQNLEDLSNENRAQLILIYGRRRIGKTTLLYEFLKNKDNALFFMADASENILDTFSDIASEKFNNVRFQNWDNFFDFLYSKSKENRFIVVIDEFQYLTAVLKSWPTILQRHWEKLKTTKIFLVLSGSLVSSIYRIAMGYGSALYGRKTGEMNIKPLNFIDTGSFFNTDINNLVKIYMILGGVPRYLEEFDSGNIYNNIIKKILNKNSFLYNEPLNLLHEEFKDLTSYFAVLDTIGSGATNFNEISVKSRIAQNKLSKVLDVLIRAELIAREESIIKSNVRNIHSYYIKDNLFNFWFKFVYPFRSLLEMNNEEVVISKIKSEINTLFGHRFEFIARDLLLYNQDKLPFAISYIGRSWGKLKNKVGNNSNYEFDVVIQDAKKYYTGIFEVKYKKLSYGDAYKIIKNMQEIYNNIGVNTHPVFGIIAKNVENKELLRQNGYYVFDLNDL